MSPLLISGAGARGVICPVFCGFLALLAFLKENHLHNILFRKYFQIQEIQSGYFQRTCFDTSPLTSLIPLFLKTLP